jgi:hypothetical protein
MFRVWEGILDSLVDGFMIFGVTSKNDMLAMFDDSARSTYGTVNSLPFENVKET